MKQRNAPVTSFDYLMSAGLAGLVALVIIALWNLK